MCPTTQTQRLQQAKLFLPEPEARTSALSPAPRDFVNALWSSRLGLDDSVTYQLPLPGNNSALSYVPDAYWNCVRYM